MFGGKSEYDRGVNTFSPEGRLLQVEYAIEAIKLGSSAIGIKVNEGVVVAVERRVESVLVEPQSIEKISEIDEHIVCAASGLITDARTLIEYARLTAQNHRFVYNEPIKNKALTQAVCDLALNFGEGDPTSKKKPTSRPYGVALIIAGIDDNGPSLYHAGQFIKQLNILLDPSGTMVEYQAKGIGAADEGIQSLLIEKYKQDLSLVEAEKLAIGCLKDVMEEKIKNDNVELWTIPVTTKKCEIRNMEYVENIIKEL